MSERSNERPGEPLPVSVAPQSSPEAAPMVWLTHAGLTVSARVGFDDREDEIALRLRDGDRACAAGRANQGHRRTGNNTPWPSRTEPDTDALVICAGTGSAPHGSRRVRASAASAMVPEPVS
jgi:hypothetical protein